MNAIENNTISPAALAAVLDAGEAHVLVDVRTPQEFASVHASGTVSIPLNELDAAGFVAQHTPGKPVYVLCQTGARARRAIEQLEAAGCTDCVLVEGGTEAWIGAGLPVHRGESTVLPLMRQVQMVVGSLAAVGSVLALTMNRWFAVLPLLLGCGLLFAGITGACGMALLLARMPWNRTGKLCSQCRCTEE
jgi:rhodanese-related sulfurtransferase